jgi:hypothetical protein
LTRSDLISIVADLPNASSVGFGARLQQVVAERINEEEEFARKQAAEAELQKRAAAAPAAEFEMCLAELAILLSSRIEPTRVQIGYAHETRWSPEGFLVYSENHRIDRDATGSPVRISAEVLVPDGRLWKSWNKDGFTRVKAEFAEYGSVKIGPYEIFFDPAERLYARFRAGYSRAFDTKIDLADALADIATTVIKERDSAGSVAGRASAPRTAQETVGFGATLLRLLGSPGERRDR